MTIVWVILGAAIGAGGGVLMGRSRVCGSGFCEVRGNRLAAIIGGAVFGGCVAYYLAWRY